MTDGAFPRPQPGQTESQVCLVQTHQLAHAAGKPVRSALCDTILFA
jgi:hypothetical protein